MVEWVAIAYVCLVVALGVGFYLAWTFGHEAWTAGIVALTIFGGMAVWSTGQGLPKPCNWELWAHDEVPVISATWEEGRAIWIWVALDRPFYCQFPWNEQKAERLAQGMEAMRQDRGRMMINPKPNEGDFSVHMRAPAPLPDKEMR